MKKTLLGMLALAISATAAAAQPSVTATLSSGKLPATSVLRQQEGFSAFPMEGWRIHGPLRHAWRSRRPVAT